MYGQGTAIGGASLGYQGDAVMKSPVTPPQIGARLDELGKAAEILHAGISELENRISGILRPVPPQVDSASGGQPTPDTAPLAIGLREIGQRIYSAQQRISALNGRVEL